MQRIEIFISHHKSYTKFIKYNFRNVQNQKSVLVKMDISHPNKTTLLVNHIAVCLVYTENVQSRKYACVIMVT